MSKISPSHSTRNRSDHFRDERWFRAGHWHTLKRTEELSTYPNELFSCLHEKKFPPLMWSPWTHRIRLGNARVSATVYHRQRSSSALL